MTLHPSIREVWKGNLEIEMKKLRILVDEYPCIAMDTEFPGVVARPIGQFKTSSDYHYQTMRCNVDLLKIIQLGLTFSTSDGRLPDGASTWQFNFQFNLNEDTYAAESIELLKKSGLDFERHEKYGIDPREFGEVLISSGFVLEKGVQWITFHSGYDFAYLLKIMTVSPLPPEEKDFFALLNLYFPILWDIKLLVKSKRMIFKGGLQELADEMQIARIGQQHQAGSDALLSALVFFELKQVVFEENLDEKLRNQIWGLSPQNGLKALGGLVIEKGKMEPYASSGTASTFPLGKMGLPATVH